MERKIGEQFELKLNIKVVESERPCVRCLFYGSTFCALLGQLGDCGCRSRSDGKNVHFEADSFDEAQEKLIEN